jgi:ParB-like chromosome segregation protein Spo0J
MGFSALPTALEQLDFIALAPVQHPSLHGVRFRYDPLKHRALGGNLLVGHHVPVGIEHRDFRPAEKVFDQHRTIVLDDETDATETSLAENVQREQMHPADEFDAFRALIESGMPPADVAARFGVTETVVQKRLKLAKVSPKLIAAYREGEMTLQHVMAFTVTDDHEAQERVWHELADVDTDPDDIRAMLTEEEVTASDRRVKFVTLKAYEKAGGEVRRDLTRTVRAGQRSGCFSL